MKKTILVMFCAIYALALGMWGCAAEPEELEAGAVGQAEQPLPTQSCTFDYYSDPAKTQYVSTCTLLCTGHWQCTGPKTAYRETTDCSSCGPACECCNIYNVCESSMRSR